VAKLISEPNVAPPAVGANDSASGDDLKDVRMEGHASAVSDGDQGKILDLLLTVAVLDNLADGLEPLDGALVSRLTLPVLATTPRRLVSLEVLAVENVVPGTNLILLHLRHRLAELRSVEVFLRGKNALKMEEQRTNSCQADASGEVGVHPTTAFDEHVESDEDGAGFQIGGDGEGGKNTGTVFALAPPLGGLLLGRLDRVAEDASIR